MDKDGLDAKQASNAPYRDTPASRPKPAYNKPPINRELYDQIASTPSRKLISNYLLPPRSGHAWRVPAKSILRLSTPEGPQVGDLNLWNATNPRERFWASRTRQLQGSHVSTGDRLWSCLPYLRPMVTIIKDSLEGFNKGGGSEAGGRCHDLLGTRCDPYVNTLLTNSTYDYHCHSNLTRAILPFHLTEFDVHDVLNVFQVTGLDFEGRYFMEASPATVDSFIEFFAEIDLICALSTCPGGDLSAWGWESKANMEDTCRPIKIEIFEIGDSNILKCWEPPEVPKYGGLHGIDIPGGEKRAST